MVIRLHMSDAVIHSHQLWYISTTMTYVIGLHVKWEFSVQKKNKTGHVNIP